MWNPERYMVKHESNVYKDAVEQFWKEQTLLTKADFLNQEISFLINGGRITFEIKEKFYKLNNKQ